MTNFKRGRGAGRGIFLGVVAAMGLALAGCGGSSQGSSAPAPAAQSSTPAQGAQSSTAAQSASAGGTATSAASSGSGSSPPAATSGTVTLNWAPPTQNVDGSPLTNLAGYNIHYGTASGQLTQTISISNPGLATYVVSNLAPGTYYFAVAAVNSAGTESPLSAEVSTTVN